MNTKKDEELKMRTPSEYTRYLKNNILTIQMLEDCAYSSNKRAKNARDNQAYYRNLRIENRFFRDKYGNEDAARLKKEEYYLSLSQLVYIKNLQDIKKSVLMSLMQSMTCMIITT